MMQALTPRADPLYLSHSLVTGAVALLFAAGCDDDEAPPTPPEPVVEQIALLRAFSGDGLTVVARLSEPLDGASVAATDFQVVGDSGAVGPAVSAVAVDGAVVTLTLAAALGTDEPQHLVVGDVRDLEGRGMDSTANRVVILGTLHLALIWHQHQPVYIDPRGDYLRGPWVRKHGTKDYYDMAAMVGDYPAVHVMVNLTPVLLTQLQTYYLDRIGPYVDLMSNSIDVTGYFAQGSGSAPVTDPWIDLLLQPTPQPQDLTPEQVGWFYADVWSSFSISEVMLARFPAYAALLAQRDSDPASFTQDDLLQMKGWFQLAWFDPDFLRGPVSLPRGDTVDLSDLVVEATDGTFSLVAPFTEAVCQRLVVEEYKVLANIVAAHRALIYDPTTHNGQIEVMTTPFFHPILPLLVDTDLALIAMPEARLPSQRFQQLEDARVQVARAVELYGSQFGGRSVTGMWPAEGAVAEAVVPLFSEQGIAWVATDRRVLESSTPSGQPVYSPYRIDADTVSGDGGDTSDELAIVFRDTEISDKIGFHYQGGTPEDNVADFLESLRRHAPPYGEDRLLTVILDGENAWEWYRLDNDAKGFLGGMYAALESAQLTGELRTVTVSEYLSGNSARGVVPHPVHDLPELEPLHAGSWIGGSYATWIGEEEENLAWDYLANVRQDLDGFGLARPVVGAPLPSEGTSAWYAYQAWESMYAAEGSDWFWWYGSDQTALGGDEPFDQIFIELLKSVYRNAQLAGVATTVPDLPPILRLCLPPTGVLATPPTVDGSFDPDDGGDPSKPNEWTQAGAGVCVDIDSGVDPNPDDDLATYYHGISTDSVYLALRFNEDLYAKLGSDYQVRLYFSHKHILSIQDGTSEQDPHLATTRSGQAIDFGAGGAARELGLDLSSGAVTASVAVVSADTWQAPQPAASVLFGGPTASDPDLLEVAIPFAPLNYQTDDPLEMLITLVEAGQEIDRAPNTNSIVLFPDLLQLVSVTFVLDATGVRLPLDAVKPIDNPPPPNGTGAAFIVGNQEPLGNWTPNSIPMADDGVTHGDASAGDNLWTFELLVPPLTDVQYKYTIGRAGEGWGPTEEFPLTNRGFIVTDRNGDRVMEVHDVFADRPEPSGSLASLTDVVND